MTEQAAIDIVHKQLEEALATMPPCAPGHIRLYRATIDPTEADKERLTRIAEQWEKGELLVDKANDREMTDLKRALAFKHRLHGKYYSHLMEATLPYFLRHVSDRKSDRALCYVDVPVEEARDYYLDNFLALRVPPKSNGEDTTIAEETLRKKRSFYKEIRAAFIKAYNGEEANEFFLPDEIIAKKQEITRIPIRDIMALGPSDDIRKTDLAKIGIALDKKFHAVTLSPAMEVRADASAPLPEDKTGNMGPAVKMFSSREIATKAIRKRQQDQSWSPNI